MRICIFLTAVVGESIFAGLCILTESYQQRVRSILGVVAVVSFVLFTSLTLIEWSLRYYTIAALLLVFAIMGVMAFIRKR